MFSAGYPLGERRLGVDVPRTFEHLDVGPVFNTQPRSPGHLSTDSFQEIRIRLTPSASPIPCVRSVVFISSSILDVYFRILEPGSSFLFRGAENQGAALVTKHLTYREDVQLAGNFEKYAKDHCDSWVEFAREIGHGNDIKPLLVTGVDMTRDFAMMSYSSNKDNLTSEFTTSAPGIDSIWGTWRITGPVYTNCGPHLSPPPSPTQITDLMSPSTSHAGPIPDEYNQCVFIRYYTVRKRLGIPRVIKAAAGPHDLGPGGRADEESLLEEQCNSDPDSSIASSLFDGEEDDDDDRSSLTSIDSESGIVIHNTTPVRFFHVILLLFRRSDLSSIGRKG